MESTAPESPVSQQVFAPEVFVPPELTDGETYHVFMSYSSADLLWTNALIQQLEDRGLKVCNHERDFTPGRLILENMSECIVQSQKVLLVLSQDFVKSRWCLLEANMSLFRDCLQRKPIVPVLLQRDLSIPLPLAHLTYLDLSHPDFSGQLLRVLCTPNHQLNNSTIVPYQPPNIYNGQVLQTLVPIFKALMPKCGVWSTEVPQQLRQIMQDHEVYKVALERINRVCTERVRFKSFKSCLPTIVSFAILLLFGGLFFAFYAPYHFSDHIVDVMKPGIIVLVILVVIVTSGVYITCLISEPRRIYEELDKAVCEANTFLHQENILIGAWNNTKLHLVYVLLDDCRRQLNEQFPERDMFKRALLTISSDYVCWLSRQPFPIQPVNPGHLEGSVCFCQYFVFSQNIEISEMTAPTSCCCGIL